MQLTGPGAIVVDYDHEWVITDTATGIEARTNDASAIYGIVRAFGAAADDDADEDSGPWHDSGDEQPA